MGIDMHIPQIGDTVYLIHTNYSFDSMYRFVKTAISKVQIRNTKYGQNVYVWVGNIKYKFTGKDAYPVVKRGGYRPKLALSFDISYIEKSIELLTFQRDLKDRLRTVQGYLNGFNIMEEKYLRMLEAVVSDLKNQELKVDA